MSSGGSAGIKKVTCEECKKIVYLDAYASRQGEDDWWRGGVEIEGGGYVCEECLIEQVAYVAPAARAAYTREQLIAALQVVRDATLTYCESGVLTTAGVELVAAGVGLLCGCIAYPEIEWNAPPLAYNLPHPEVWEVM